MNIVYCVFALAVFCIGVDSRTSPPKVVVYSRDRGEFGKSNVLTCFVSGFHPPDIQIELLRGGAELQNSNQTDLAFKKGWNFHLTKHVEFTPELGEKYICRVTHVDVKDYNWDSNM